MGKLGINLTKKEKQSLLERKTGIHSKKMPQLLADRKRKLQYQGETPIMEVKHQTKTNKKKCNYQLVN